MYFQSEKKSFLQQIIKNLLHLVHTLYGQLQQKRQEFLPKYRLVDWYVKKQNGEGFCQIQIIGTSQVLDYRPQEIAGNESLLYGFSAEDISTIVNLAHQERRKPTLKILEINYLEQAINIQKNNGEIMIIKITELHLLTKSLTEFNLTDAFKLGRLMGDEDNKINLHLNKSDGK